VQQQQLQQAAVGSSASSPPLSPRWVALHGSSRPSLEGSAANTGASLPPQALGLPAIATTLPVPIPGTSPPAAATGALCWQGQLDLQAIASMQCVLHTIW
jgi:hypothetical protein